MYILIVYEISVQQMPCIYMSFLLLYLFLHNFAEQIFQIFYTCIFWIARCTCICMSGFCQEIKIFFFDCFQFCRDSNINRKFSYSIDRCSSTDISSTPLTPIARAISRYFPPVQSWLYSITIGSIIAHATPCGVS